MAGVCQTADVRAGVPVLRFGRRLLARLAVALEVPPKELVLLALEDYLAHGEDQEPAEGVHSTDAGRCEVCPASLPGGVTCAGECG